MPEQKNKLTVFFQQVEIEGDADEVAAAMKQVFAPLHVLLSQLQGGCVDSPIVDEQHEANQQ